MSKYIIIDSYKSNAENLLTQLDGSNTGSLIIDSSQFESVSEIFESFAAKIKTDNTKIILVNADTKVKSNNQKILELVLWIRCKIESFNPIVVYSTSTLQATLRKQPENYFLISKGCIFKQSTTISSDIAEIKALKPIAELESLKPFIKPKVDEILSANKHRFANYAAMLMMLRVSKKIWNIKNDSDVLADFTRKYPELCDFLLSLNYYILNRFYDFEFDGFDINQMNLKTKSRNKNILFIDDLADKGWLPIVSQMLYGQPGATEIKSVKIHTKSDTEFDEVKTIIELEAKISEHKPHLILLDLRLCDERGKRGLNELGGYKVLKHLKNSSLYKGIPVIMFTASSKAETIKELLKAGAVSVWTKPGIDEGLSKEGIVKRYGQLLKLVSEIFNPDYNSLKLINDIYDETLTEVDIKGFDFNEIRNQVLRNLDFIKYRMLLNKTGLALNIPEPYKSADAIYIDANTLITGERTMLFHEIISCVYKLALLTHKSEFNYLDSYKKKKRIKYPKVVIMNCIFDEVIKIAKVNSIEKKIKSKVFHKWDLRFYRAVISQMVIKELIEQEFARTEFEPNTNKREEPIHKLKNPKENVHADGHILDEISNLTVTNKNFSSFYPINTKVVFVTGDSKLKEKIQLFNTDNNLTVISRERLIQDINNIEL